MSRQHDVALGSYRHFPKMTWEINLRTRTAKTGGYVVQFVKLADPSMFDRDCFRDPDGEVWCGKALPTSCSIRDEALRMHMLHEAADAYGKAVRKAINPFPAE